MNNLKNMTYKYLYIDDNTPENAKGITTGLEQEDVLKVIFRNPTGSWELERDDILSKEFEEYNGLIVDLNLEETPNEHQKHAKYKGSSLAQEIRNISKAGEIAEIPIILLSATVNLNKYFDKTNEDLFDLIVKRDELKDVFIPIRNKLIALAGGYKKINEVKGKIDFSNLLLRDVKLEDLRMIAQLQLLSSFPTHTLSKFIVKHLLDQSGPLITQKLMATRLGIDIEKSDDWIKLISNFDFKYKGVFHEGWDRWWMSGLEKWWKQNMGPVSLRNTDAASRVSVISEKTGFRSLQPIQKTDKSRSNSFWTLCAGSQVAIDIVDGLLVADQDGKYPWQDKSYVSIEEALQPSSKSRWKELAVTRYDEAKKQIHEYFVFKTFFWGAGTVLMLAGLFFWMDSTYFDERIKINQHQLQPPYSSKYVQCLSFVRKRIIWIVITMIVIASVLWLLVG